MTDAPSQGLRWEEGVPISRRFDDPYYSRADGLAESRYVFLGGCGLPERWKGRGVFQIAELGFGTGLNFCATLAAWRESGAEGQLLFTSFEKYPISGDEIARALRVWPELLVETGALLSAYTPDGGRIELPGATLELIVGDAREAVPVWHGKADAWFLDGFAPARNPELWEPALIETVVDHSAAGATFATYSAAGAVRRALQDAGLEVIRAPGYGTKREMLIAKKPV